MTDVTISVGNTYLSQLLNCVFVRPRSVAQDNYQVAKIRFTSI